MKDTNQVRVLVVDSSAVVRERLVTLLSETDHVQVVGDASDADGALSLCGRCQPDAVVMDIALPGGEGLALLGEIKRMQPDCLLVVLTNDAHPALRVRCFQAGATWFLEKHSELEQVSDVLQRHTPRQSAE